MTDHKVGSIVRIKLHNFLTYTDAEFYPCSQLNMVIGPNGTGKSTIVCAIALGLAGKTEVLGRAKDLSEFVKHGEEESCIELELKENATANLVIERRFNKRERASKWKVNGQSSTMENVKEQISRLNIQVDNLCQFLPQDRVSSFANMDSKRLLRETERAAGGDALLQKHESLIKLRNQEKSLIFSMESNKQELETAKSRNNAVEREVTRYMEREVIQKEIDLLEKAVLWKKYDASVQEYLEVKTLRENLKVEMEALTAREEPLRASMQILQQEYADAETIISDNKKEYMELTRSMSDMAKEFEDLLDTIDAKQKELENLIKSESLRKAKMEQLKAYIATQTVQNEQMLESLIQQGIVDQNGRENGSKSMEITDKIRELADVIGKVVSEATEFNGNVKDLKIDMHRLGRLKDKNLENLRKLDDFRSQKLQYFNTPYDSDTYKAVQWLSENAHRFRRKVYEPIGLEINVRDKSVVNIVEQTIGSATLKCFVTTCEDDYRLFSREVLDGLKLRVNIQNCSHPLTSFRPTLTKEEIQNMGFDGYVLDFIEGPDPVLSVLLQRTPVHLMPVAKDDKVNHELVQNMNEISSYFCGDTAYGIKRAYGSQSIQASQIRPARLLVRSVDTSLKAKFEQELQELEIQISEKQSQLNALETTLDGFRERDKRLRQEQDELRKTRTEFKKKREEYEKKVQSVENEKHRLLKAEMSQLEVIQEESDLKTMIKDLNIQRAKKTFKFHELQMEASRAFIKRTEFTLKSIEAQSEMDTKEDELQASTERLKKAKEELITADQTFKEYKNTSRAALDKAKASCKDLTEEELESLETWKALPLNQIHIKLAENQAKSDMILLTNPGVIEAYNARKKQIAEMEREMEKASETLLGARESITELEESWLPLLENYVTRINTTFSSSFTRMGCAGEVSLGKHQDYENWGIEIRVKFRDNEKLELLTGHRQSGGERSVSTMLYLIALQELSKSPFRVVDEINQGMDPRNERIIHQQIVQAACGESTSQYFLVTPKLLPDLEYRNEMRILCVFNGKWQPDGFDSRPYLHGRV